MGKLLNSNNGFTLEQHHQVYVPNSNNGRGEGRSELILMPKPSYCAIETIN